jgi:TetR/AcrR family transcriptional regulator, repressor for uid operon
MSIRFIKRAFVLGGDMPKVTEAHIEARRQQILDAAAECFARKGFHHSTMHDICQMAELSPGAVYRYFASKDDIIAAMEEQGRQHSAAIIEAVTRERKDTLDVLEGLVDVFFSKLEDVRDCAVHIELWAEALSNPRIREMVVGIDDSIRNAFVTKIVRDAQKRGEINAKLDADSVARVMMAFWDGLVLQKTLDPEVDIWKYVAVMKSMMGGTFWQKREAGRS